MKIIFMLVFVYLLGCNGSTKPNRMQAVNPTRNSADNSPVKFKLVASKFERCEKAPDNIKGFRKVFTFKTETEVELVGEFTPDAACKKRYADNELTAMQGRIVVPGTYEKKSTLEGIFHFAGEIPELIGQGAYKISGMTLKISPSTDLANPDVYLYFE